MHLTTAGPISLLLLPKCPLCFVPILAFFGVALPASAAMPVVVGTLLAVWTAMLLLMTRRQPRLRVAVCFGAIVSLAAVGADNRVLLWAGVAGMIAAGLTSLRSRARDAAEETICCVASLRAVQPREIRPPDSSTQTPTILVPTHSASSFAWRDRS